MLAVDLPPLSYAELLGHLTWRPPAIVQEFFSTDALRAAKGLRRQLDAALQELDAWRAEGIRHREIGWSNVQKASKDTANLEATRALLNASEGIAARMARDIAQARKRYAKGERAASKISAELRKATHEANTRVLQLLERELEERVDFGLFVRAMMAELDPASFHGGATFSDPDAMEAYLDRALS